MSSTVSVRAATSTRRPGIPAILASTAGLLVVALAAYGRVSGRTRYLETGDQFPGWFTSVATPVLFLVGLAGAAICLGALAYTVVSARPDGDGAIGFEVFRAHRLIERVSTGWVVLALAMAVFSAADRSGIAISRVFDNAAIFSLIGATEQSKAWLVSAACAFVVAVVIRWSLRWTAHVVLLLPAVIGVIALGVAGSAGQGPGHDYTTGTAIVVFAAIGMVSGMTIAGAITVAADTPDDDLRQTAGRVLYPTAVLLVAAIVYSVVQIAFLVPLRFLFDTAFGRFALVALVAAVVALVVVIRAVRALRAAELTRSGFVTATTIVAICMLVSLATFAGMETRTAPGLLVHDFTVLDVFLGYNLPDRPTPWTLATMWRLDLVLGIGAIALAVAYGFGVRALRRRGIVWSKWRTISWMIGCLSLLVVTSSGLRTYGMALFSIHMIEHMTLNMFIPVLLVLGAPVTLALRALPAATRGSLPGPREWIV